MLVLSRKESEELLIGDIVVRIIEIRRDQVRIGIEAPRDVPVHRREIHERIKREGPQLEPPRETI